MFLFHGFPLVFCFASWISDTILIFLFVLWYQWCLFFQIRPWHDLLILSDLKFSLGYWHMSMVTALRKLRQEDCEFKVTEQDPVPQNKKSTPQNLDLKSICIDISGSYSLLWYSIESTWIIQQPKRVRFIESEHFLLKSSNCCHCLKR
jgi:hypothetical protein